MNEQKYLEISKEECNKLIGKLWPKLFKPKLPVYKGIIIPLRGGYFLGKKVGEILDLKTYLLEISSYKGLEQEDDFILGDIPILQSGRYLVCDDIYDTGNTTEKIKKIYPYPNITLDFCYIVSKQKRTDILYSKFVTKDTWVKFHWESEEK